MQGKNPGDGFMVLACCSATWASISGAVVIGTDVVERYFKTRAGRKGRARHSPSRPQPRAAARRFRIPRPLSQRSVFARRSCARLAADAARSNVASCRTVRDGAHVHADRCCAQCRLNGAAEPILVEIARLQAACRCGMGIPLPPCRKSMSMQATPGMDLSSECPAVQSVEYSRVRIIN